MTVAKLIKYLQSQPQTLTVVYRCCSEHCFLDTIDIKILELSAERSDGWVQDKRPDKPTKKYLVLPGN